MGMRTNTAQWLPNQNRWQIKVQKDGVRKTFTSAKPGRTGQREANAKADAWLDEGICSTTKRCSEVWKEYLISVRATAGTSYAQQVEKFGQNYILPVVGDRRIGDLNTGMLQDVLNRAYKEGSMNPQATRKSRGNLSRKTLQGIRAVEVSFVKWARQHKYTALRPEDEGLTVPRGARPKGRKILQPDALRVLHPLAAAELHAQLQQRAFEEERPLRGDDPIFLLENEHSLYNYWQFYQRSNSIDPPVSLYELRHTFVSIIEDAVSPAELRRMVGHSKSMDTYGWYSHAVDGRADTAAMAVSDALAEYSPRAK